MRRSTLYQRIRMSALLIPLSSIGALHAAEFFVNQQGSDENGGATRARAFLTIERGVDALQPGDTLTIGPGEYRVLYENTHFGTALRRKVQHLYVHFVAGPPYDAVEPHVFSFPVWPLMTSIFDEIRAAREMGERLGPRVSLACRTLITYGLSRLPADRVPAAPSEPRVLEAMRGMDVNLSSPPSNGELAKQAGMSTNAFTRLFRSVAGRSPQAYLMDKRIERACILLSGGRESVDEVAAATGFCDRYHFSRVFKRLRSVGPAEYRKRCVQELGGRLEV